MSSRFYEMKIARTPLAHGLVFILAMWMSGAYAEDAGPDDYLIQAGDVLNISVWHEPDLNLDVVVRPDGFISVPLIGDVKAMGKSVALLRTEISARLQILMPDTAVSVSTRQLLGNKIYVIGKVNNPGEFLLNRSVDVMQALSMAKGMSKYADTDRIRILRRGSESQQAIPFNYDEVEQGNGLEQNIVLRSGDVVVVP